MKEIEEEMYNGKNNNKKHKEKGKVLHNNSYKKQKKLEEETIYVKTVANMDILLLNVKMRK